MAFIVELFPDRQLDFSIDPERLCDLLDQMVGDGEIITESINSYAGNKSGYEPVIFVADLPLILERLKFTLLPEIKRDKLLISLFAPQPIRMEMVSKKDIQPHVTSSSSG